MKLQRRLAWTAAAIAASIAAAANAASFDSLIVFGDSLSDNGNTFAATGFPPFPYAQRFSNGPVAVEYMAASLGLTLQDYAYGGAITGSAYFDPDGPGPQIARPNYVNAAYLPSPPAPALPNMLDELGSYMSATAGHANPNALYVVWGGANDIFLADLQGRLSSEADIQTVLGEAVTNITTIAGALVAAGATHVFVPGMGDLGLTPDFAGNAALGSAMAQSFNAGLQSALAANLPAGTWRYFDTFGLQDAVAANPAAYGFTDVTHACVDLSANTLCGLTLADQNKYLFWDAVHPTTAGHQIVGEAFAAAVPEPETYALMLAGLAVLGLLTRRRAAA
jgi:phospholipase/lecithinase/hemolysin